MKNFTLLFLALISINCYSQNSASGTATVNAEIVNPISISVENSLDFGRFTTSASEATVRILTDGTRTFSQTDMKIPSENVSGVPTFTVSKGTDETYGVALTVTQAPKETGGNTMTLDNLEHSLDADGGNTAESFTVGGTLTVPADQTAGTYTGEVTVTVTYE